MTDTLQKILLYTVDDGFDVRHRTAGRFVLFKDRLSPRGSQRRLTARIIARGNRNAVLVNEPDERGGSRGD